MTVYNVALDPSTSCTGVVLFEDGKWASYFCLKPPSGYKRMKMDWLWDQLREYVIDLMDRGGGDEVGVAIEDYSRFVRLQRKNSIPVLTEYIGFIRGCFQERFPHMKVEMVDKGAVTKKHAEMLARKAGLPPGLEKDIYDAYLVGKLAGFEYGRK